MTNNNNNNNINNNNNNKLHRSIKLLSKKQIQLKCRFPTTIRNKDQLLIRFFSKIYVKPKAHELNKGAEVCAHSPIELYPSENLYDMKCYLLPINMKQFIFIGKLL